MNSKRAFEIEIELYEVCREYIDHGSEPRDEIMEDCYQAYASVQKYRMALKKRRSPSGGNPRRASEIIYHTHIIGQARRKSNGRVCQSQSGPDPGIRSDRRD